MWIVRLALRRPYTFVVVSLLIAVLGLMSIASMPTDIFPDINIPVISVIWTYGGLSATEMQDRITTVVERAMTTTVSGIEHLESESVRGNTVIKLYFQPAADRHHAAAHPAVQRRRRTGDHAQSRQRSTVRAGDQRSREQLHPHAAGD